MGYNAEQLRKYHVQNVQQRYGAYVSWLRPKTAGDTWDCVMHQKPCRKTNVCVCSPKKLGRIDWTAWGALLTDGTTLQITELLSESPQVSATLPDATVVEIEFPKCEFHIAVMRMARKLVGGAPAQALAEMCRETLLKINPESLAQRNGIRGTRPLWGPSWTGDNAMPGVDDADWLTWRARYFPKGNDGAVMYDITVNLWQTPTVVVFVEPDNTYRRKTAEANDLTEALPFSQLVSSAYANFQAVDTAADATTTTTYPYNTRSGGLASRFGYTPSYFAPPPPKRNPELVVGNRPCPFPRVQGHPAPEVPAPLPLNEAIIQLGDGAGVPHWSVAWMLAGVATPFHEAPDVAALCERLYQAYGKHVARLHPVTAETEAWIQTVRRHLDHPSNRRMLAAALAA